MNDKKAISVTIEYTGHAPYHDDVHGNPVIKAIKLAAMKAFGLEPSAADKYVLQYEGTDLDDTKHIQSLGKSDIKLALTLKHEPTKG